MPPYQLPPLLVSSEGKPITTPEEWFDIRRPQIMALFGNLVYGVVPAPELPIKTTIEVVKTDREFMGGKATRKDVRIRFENAKGSAEMLILVFTPNNADRPAPAFLLHSFASTKDDLPVDQHMLIACIAPRPVYVASGVEDFWADPRGKYLSAYHASPVYRLLGKTGLDSEASTPVGQAILQSSVGYHNRPGGHSVEMFDWLRFLEFAGEQLRTE
ncbi:MAG: hypothetical protein KJ072_05755 [Verrucomicrobia bacterium]|nr:hypothetical protein [Verrucomicrobiota bacterium]